MTYDEIVTNTHCPTLVLAGPGAGKTYLLADRVKRLLEKGTDKDTIRVLAFGKDAAQQMFARLVDSKGFGLDPNDLPPITTIHSLGFEIVTERTRHLGLRKSDLRVQENDQIRRLMFRDSAFSIGLSAGVAVQARKCKEGGDCSEDTKAEKCLVCRKYWEIMAKCNRVDFDDQVLFACRVLEKDPRLLAHYQKQCCHLLVDEYQDINAAQFRMIQLLSRESVNGLFVVGDDAQSIYSFRGASTKFILEFRKYFPSAKCVPLRHSYRCHPKTMGDAVRVLSRYYKAWKGPFDLEYHRAKGKAPSVWQLPSGVAEARIVARIARRFLSDNKSVLILVPKREFFPLISRKLRERGVPHDCPINLLSRSSNNRLAAAESFLRWVMDPKDSFSARTSIEECINRGTAKVPGASKDRRCRPETIEFREKVEAAIALLWDAVDRKTDLFTALQGMEENSAALRKVRSVLETLLHAFLGKVDQDVGQFAKALATEAGVWPTPATVAEDLLAVMSILGATQPTGPRNAQLMTMRKAKGLEADVVIMVGLEDDIMPGDDCDNLSEAARLFYVSMTRAKRKLFLFHSFSRRRNISFGDDLTHKERSRFLDAIGRPSEYKRPA